MCVRQSVRWRKQNIMFLWRYSNVNELFAKGELLIWFPEKTGQMKFEVFLSTGIYTEVVVLIRHVKVQLFAPYMVTVLRSVWYVLHVKATCKSSCSVLLMQDFSLLSLSFLWRHHSSSEATRWVSRRTRHSLSSTVETVRNFRWSHVTLKRNYAFSLNRQAKEMY